MAFPFNCMFLKFIIDKHEQLLQNGFRRYSKVVNPETYIAALLTNHLLSCLVFGSQYRISNDYRDQPPFCPCKDITCDKHIVYGQTSLGEFLNIHLFILSIYLNLSTLSFCFM